VEVVDNKKVKKFLEKTHLQGYCPASVKLGLFWNNELQAIATFGKPRFNKNYDWELIRYSVALNTTVVGGLGKLIKYFLKNYEVTSIISYADRRWTKHSKNLYQLVGFEFLNSSSPNYKYFKRDAGKIELQSRTQFQKHKLQYKLPIFNKILTEYQNMQLNGYCRIWDCGNLIYEYKNLEKMHHSMYNEIYE
jgi:hypothetical protein